MNANAKAWVEALRSGQYQQTKGYLQRDGGFCCLGVACELAIADGVEISARPATGTGGVNYIEYQTQVGYLPDAVREWLGLATDNGRFHDDRAYLTCLTDLNDGGKNFEQIADIIESEPKGLFR